MNETPSILNYTENNEWTLVSYKASRSEIYYSNWIEKDYFSEIKYTLLMRRKSLFVLQNYVIPVQMLCILTLISFFMPLTQQMVIGISIMLSFAVFKLRLSEDVPVQSDSIPLINVYFSLCIFFSLLSMIWFSAYNYMKDSKLIFGAKIRSLILKRINLTNNDSFTRKLKLNFVKIL
jgi:hypothetical protein